MSHKPLIGAVACLLTRLDDIPAVANSEKAAPGIPPIQAESSTGAQRRSQQKVL
jgi:hypothetical protein